jgi:branched-chain amino acid transport system permease protein
MTSGAAPSIGSERTRTAPDRPLGGKTIGEEKAMAGETQIQDRQALYVSRFRDHLRDTLKPLVTDDLIEEHRRTLGRRRSDTLERLLAYFRSSEVAGKYAILAIKPFLEYRIVALSGQHGVPPRVVDDRVYVSPADAQHGVFLKRVEDLRNS